MNGTALSSNQNKSTNTKSIFSLLQHPLLYAIIALKIIASLYLLPVTASWFFIKKML